jgi:hypothetical protein
LTATGTSCSDTSAIDTIHVHPLPASPTITGPMAINCSYYHLQLIASETDSGTYNWSNGIFGPVDDIYSGGAYRVWFTNAYGCTNYADISVPPSVDQFFPYFPVGCYNLCQQQLPLYLLGIPGIDFSSWAWLKNSTAVESGSGLMSPYFITGSGVYQWSLSNGLCAQTSGDMDVTTANCNLCQDTFTAYMLCDTLTPAGYDLHIQLSPPIAGCTYTIGTNIGPVDPFSGYLLSGGLQPPMTLSFTTFLVSSTVNVEVSYTRPDGSKCFQVETLSLPRCRWVAERNGDTGDSLNNNSNLKALISSALLIFPNPATNNVTISYNYGKDSYKERSLTIYDELGRKIQSFAPPAVNDSWYLNTSTLAAGLYIVRMEADGQTLQLQRVVITH